VSLETNPNRLDMYDILKGGMTTEKDELLGSSAMRFDDDVCEELLVRLPLPNAELVGVFEVFFLEAYVKESVLFFGV
jgi:hypothetical protein